MQVSSWSSERLDCSHLPTSPGEQPDDFFAARRPVFSAPTVINKRRIGRNDAPAAERRTKGFALSLPALYGNAESADFSRTRVEKERLAYSVHEAADLLGVDYFKSID